jgi:hypothetical protein
MSKEMRNLIRITHAAQNNRLFLHVGYNTRTKFCKMTSDKDCLPADITHYRTAEFKNKEDLQNKINMIEGEGYFVCVDTEYYFYETKN